MSKDDVTKLTQQTNNARDWLGLLQLTTNMQMKITLTKFGPPTLA